MAATSQLQLTSVLPACPNAAGKQQCLHTWQGTGTFLALPLWQGCFSGDGGACRASLCCLPPQTPTRAAAFPRNNALSKMWFCFRSTRTSYCYLEHSK